MDQVLPVLTAIDVESGMAMAVLAQDKNQQRQYLIRCLQTFMFESGRAQATLSTTTLQSDQEEYIQNLLKAVAKARKQRQHLTITGILVAITRKH